MDGSNSRLARVSVLGLALAVILALGFGCLIFWPKAPSSDPESWPFYLPADQEPNPEQMRILGLSDTRGQRMGFRLALLSIGALAALLSAGVAGPIALKRLGGWAGQARGWIERTRSRRGHFIGAAIVLFLLLKMLPALGKVPDFSQIKPEFLARWNMHWTMTMSHADRLASGAVLFRDTTPKYGVLLPAALGALERQLGLFSLGSILRTMVVLEIAYVLAAVFLYLRWARRRWAVCLLPFLLLLPYYYSATAFPVQPNHTPWRYLGIPLALTVFYLLRASRPGRVQVSAGLVSAVAILCNLESGIAVTVGLMALVYLRYGPGGAGPRSGRWPAILLRLLGGFLAGFGGFAVFCRLFLGNWPDVDGFARYMQFVRLSVGGLGSFPYQGDLWTEVIIPTIVFTHTSAVLLYTCMRRPYGFRSAYRAAVCSMLLVWFAYYANRPHAEYMRSYWLPYGFILIDTTRYALLAVRRPRRYGGPERAAVAMILLVLVPIGYGRIIWDANPARWEFRGLRLSVPIRKPRIPPGRANVLVSNAFFNREYATDLRRRAEFLRRKQAESGGRVIYFTVDSFLIPRFSAGLSWQEFADPIEALDRGTYRRLLDAVVSAGHDEIYFEARNESSLVFYGDAFRMLRRDLGVAYRLDHVESGWEVWKRQERLARHSRGG
jgi:hypothetical protein